jgi:hypothetical protein
MEPMMKKYEIAKPDDDDCPTCGAPDVEWPTCKQCGSTDIGYLHDSIARTLAKKDMAVLDWCENLSELRGMGTWL